MTDKEKLREVIEAMEKVKDKQPSDNAMIIFEAAAEYLKILEGDMVVVPREPTQGMISEAETFETCLYGCDANGGRGIWGIEIDQIEDLYKAMIAAGGEDE